MADSDCAVTDAGDQDRALTLRVVGLFAILVASAVGVWLPWFTRAKGLELATFFGTVFAAGVVLATGFVHILPDGADALTNPCLGFSSNFPWAETFAGGAVITVFSIEYFLRQWLRKRLGLPESSDSLGHSHGMLPDAEAVAAALQLDANEPGKSTATAAEGEPDPEAGSPVSLKKNHSLVLAENTVAAAMLEMGIVFHSVFVGIDLGIQTDPNTARALMIALIFHQGFEGLALGAALVRAQCDFTKFTLLALIFCVITPIGCAIGLGMGASYNDNGKTSLGFNGAFNSVSAGILIYNGLVDIIVPVFTLTAVIKGRIVMQLLAIAIMFAGYSAMALIAKWV